MSDEEISAASVPQHTPWNKGKLTGAKPPLKPRHVWSRDEDRAARPF
jgi:hypothetical protein